MWIVPHRWTQRANIRHVEYPEGNHVCNNLAYRYRALSADWLANALGAQSSSQPPFTSR